MTLPWTSIHDLEVREDYPAAIDALEARLLVNPADPEAIIRLGFNLWYAVAENDRMGKDLPVQQYASRFMKLFHQNQTLLMDNPDFCWAFGLGIGLFWLYFPGATEELGKTLLQRARDRDAFWAKMNSGTAQAEVDAKLKGRGIFESYYCIK